MQTTEGYGSANRTRHKGGGTPNMLKTWLQQETTRGTSPCCCKASFFGLIPLFARATTCMWALIPNPAPFFGKQGPYCKKKPSKISLIYT